MEPSKELIKQTQLTAVELIKNNNIRALENLIKEYNSSLNRPLEFYDLLFYNATEEINKAVGKCIIQGNEKILKILLDAGLCPNSHTQAIKNPRLLCSFIHLAASHNHLNLVKILVESGADIYFEKYSHHRNNNDGLRAAVNNGNIEIAHYLLDCGANPNDTLYDSKLNDRITFLGKAASDNNIQLFELLISYGADIKEALEYAYNNIYSTYSHLDFQLSSFNNDKKIMMLKRANLPILNPNEEMDKELIETLTALTKLNSDLEKSYYLTLFCKKILNHYAPDQHDVLTNKLHLLIDEFKIFEDEKAKCLTRHNQLKIHYQRIVKTCLDYAIGHDISCILTDERNSLAILGNLDISEFNFVGISIHGKPVTKEMLKGRPGINQAILTETDLFTLKNKARRDKLLTRLKETCSQTATTADKDGIYHFIELDKAASLGLKELVKNKLAVNNLKTIELESALVSAARHGHDDIVKLLFEAHIAINPNEAKHVFAETQQFKKDNLTSHTFEISKGHLRIISSLPILHDECQIILPNNYLVTEAMTLIKKLDKNLFKGFIDSLKSTLPTDQPHFIVIINASHKPNSFSYLVYDHTKLDAELLIKINKVIELAADRNFYPIIITNRNNYEVINEIIRSQHQFINKNKSATLEAIEAARCNQHTTIVDYLESKIDINLQDENGNTLLHKAVMNNDLNRVKVLIQRGATINLLNKDGLSPLAMAVNDCYPSYSTAKIKYKIAHRLIECKADPNLFKYNSPLAMAFESGNSQMAELLLSLIDKKPIKMTTFLDKKACVNPWYVDLMFKSLNHDNSIELLTLLKKFGADFNTKDFNKTTLLLDVINQLPSKNNVSNGMARLHRAGYGMPWAEGLEKAYQNLMDDENKAFQKSLHLLEFLFENGVDPTITDENGRLPLTHLRNTDLSHIKGAKETLLELFTKYGANHCPTP